jgi:hypothetical protein
MDHLEFPLPTPLPGLNGGEKTGILGCFFIT